jgi:hypothetical protein
MKPTAKFLILTGQKWDWYDGRQSKSGLISYDLGVKKIFVSDKSRMLL